MARKSDVYREAIVSLHVSIQEALDSIESIDDMRAQTAAAILSAALEYTQIDQLDKDCGCG